MAYLYDIIRDFIPESYRLQLRLLKYDPLFEGNEHHFRFFSIKHPGYKYDPSIDYSKFKRGKPYQRYKIADLITFTFYPKHIEIESKFNLLCYDDFLMTNPKSAYVNYELISKVNFKKTSTEGVLLFFIKGRMIEWRIYTHPIIDKKGNVIEIVTLINSRDVMKINTMRVSDFEFDGVSQWEIMGDKKVNKTIEGEIVADGFYLNSNQMVVLLQNHEVRIYGRFSGEMHCKLGKQFYLGKGGYYDFNNKFHKIM